MSKTVESGKSAAQTTAVRQQLVMQLLKGIQQDIQQYDELQHILQALQASYLNFDGEAMQRMMQRQQPLLAVLAQRSTQRTVQLRQLGLPATPQGIRSLFQALPPALREKMQQQWQRLESVIVACRQLNQHNGQLSASFGELLAEISQGSQRHYARDQLMQM